ncbi:hypothetical protein R1sor_013894 [Riccia sorocarpa]|uniref:Uncharacterized protein n=1 Tax=Riccia sorocarpa TaxID=122646 RepID=A0ABD3H7W0_9MARC
MHLASPDFVTERGDPRVLKRASDRRISMLQRSAELADRLKKPRNMNSTFQSGAPSSPEVWKDRSSELPEMGTMSTPNIARRIYLFNGRNLDTMNPNRVQLHNNSVYDHSPDRHFSPGSFPQALPYLYDRNQRRSPRSSRMQEVALPPYTYRPPANVAPIPSPRRGEAGGKNASVPGQRMQALVWGRQGVAAPSKDPLISPYGAQQRDVQDSPTGTPDHQSTGPGIHADRRYGGSGGGTPLQHGGAVKNPFTKASAGRLWCGLLYGGYLSLPGYLHPMALPRSGE